MMDAHQKNYAVIAMSYTCFLNFMETDPVPAGKCQVLKGNIFFQKKWALEALVPAEFSEMLMKQRGTEKYSCLSKEVFLHNQFSVLEPPSLH